MLDNAGASFPNEDPGVNSDEEDDMFQVLCGLCLHDQLLLTLLV